MVFCAAGAGNFQTSTSYLQATVQNDGWPVQIVPFDWSHGYGRVIADQNDFRHARAEGGKLAQLIVDYHHHYPGVRIYLFAHSAGSAVVLAAVELLPPGYVDGVALLAPSVSAFYDLRPALCRVNCFIDVYHSRRDWLYLGVGSRVVGTSDNTHRVAAGRFGFRPLVDHADDVALYDKLRQIPWERGDRAAGHNGSHFGGYQPDYLRANIIPSFFSDLAPEEP